MLKIYDVSLVVVARLVPLVAAIDRHDPDLARQLRKARSSMPLNIGEGSHARGSKRNLHYSYAKGSAQESIAILETTVASQHIKEAPPELVEMPRRIIGTLHNPQLHRQSPVACVRRRGLPARRRVLQRFP